MRVKKNKVIQIPKKKVNILLREAGISRKPDQDINEIRKSLVRLRQILAEAIARKTLISLGIPCWRSDKTPDEENRYSILFMNGRRAFAVMFPRTSTAVDSILAAKCDYVLAVKLFDDNSGTLEGFLTWFEYRSLKTGFDFVDLESSTLHKPEELSDILGISRYPGLEFFLKSILLFFRGEFPALAPLHQMTNRYQINSKR